MAAHAEPAQHLNATMIRDELLAKLNVVECNDIEFKEAASAVPKDALTTVSAFTNTAGGHLVFGVRQKGDNFESWRRLGDTLPVIENDKAEKSFRLRLSKQKLPTEEQLQAQV